MAPDRPSPHRFRRGASPQKAAKTTSAPTSSRQAVAHYHAYEPQQSPVQDQFAATPRFALKKAPKQLTPRSPSPARPSLVNALRESVHVRSRENVEESSASACGDTSDAHGPDPGVSESLERRPPEALVDLPYSPKRRRLDDADAHTALGRPVFRPPNAAITRPHVRFAPTQTFTITSTAEDHASNRPAFLRSSAAPRDTSTDPLPEAFSPHRRGQKFLPGGIASVVQQWIIEAGQSAVQSRRAQACLQGDDFEMKVKIKDVMGNGPFVAEAYTTEGEQIMLLMAQNASQTRGQDRVAKGTMIGVRAPTWNVAVDGKNCSVAVDWKLLT